jgi:hypothetical protein
MSTIHFDDEERENISVTYITKEDAK